VGRAQGRRAVLVTRILEAIDTSDACAFDVSTFNENVLFELGYAIARAKSLLLLLDKTDDEAKARWRDFQLP
jgi:nucleoside 2-deoxyribosyltransferase